MECYHDTHLYGEVSSVKGGSKFWYFLNCNKVLERNFVKLSKIVNK